MNNRNLKMFCLMLVLGWMQFSRVAFAEPLSTKVHYAGLFDVKKDTLRLESLKRTVEIPAVLNQVFGIYYELKGGSTSKGMLVQEVVRNASGAELVRHRVVTGSGNVLAFSFDESAELVEGQWTFEVFLGTELLAS